MKINNIDELVAEIISGKRLDSGDDVSFLLNVPLDEVAEGAGKLQHTFVANLLTFVLL